MKTYCPECLKRSKSPVSVCPHCGKAMGTSLSSEDDIRHFVQKLHKKTNDLRHYMSHTLSALVIGAILLVIAFFFYYLSFVTSVDKSTGLKVSVVNTSCVEFWVSMVALVVGGILFLTGLILSLVVSRQKRQVLADIDHVRESGDLSSTPVKPIIVVAFLKITSSIKHAIWVAKYKKAHKSKKEGN